MRILHLVDRLSTRGGAPRILLDMVEYQAPAHEIGVACGGVEKGLVLPSGVEVHRIRGLGESVESSRGLGQLAPLLEKADVVHVHTVMNPLALKMAVDSGRALVTVQDHRVFCPGAGKVTLDGTTCEKAMGERVCAGCFENPEYAARLLALTRARRDAIKGATLHVLSRYMERELAAVDLSGAVVLAPWVEAAVEPSCRGDSVLIGGRLVSHKGVLQGVAAWRESGVKADLRVAGAGPLADQMEGVVHLGWLSREQTREEIRRAGVLLFPGRWQEPFGLMAVEALAQGTPVIAMESGGIEEFGDAGCELVARGDVHAMARILSRLWQQPSRMESLGRAGWELVRERFSISVLGPRLNALYERVASA